MYVCLILLPNDVRPTTLILLPNDASLPTHRKPPDPKGLRMRAVADVVVECPPTPATAQSPAASTLSGKARRWVIASRRYVEPMAVLEALVSIVSGVLLWIGFWDLCDIYIIPETWYGKVCMILFGLTGPPTQCTHSTL